MHFLCILTPNNIFHNEKVPCGWHSSQQESMKINLGPITAPGPLKCALHTCDLEYNYTRMYN